MSAARTLGEAAALSLLDQMRSSWLLPAHPRGEGRAAVAAVAAVLLLSPSSLLPRPLRAAATAACVLAFGFVAAVGDHGERWPGSEQKKIRDCLERNKFGSAGLEIVLERRMEGPECSVLALCDGSRMVVLPPAQDHKRAFDGDLGPNTGGMGAFAPTPIVPPDMLENIRCRQLNHGSLDDSELKDATEGWYFQKS